MGDLQHPLGHTGGVLPCTACNVFDIWARSKLLRSGKEQSGIHPHCAFWHHRTEATLGLETYLFMSVHSCPSMLEHAETLLTVN